MLNLSHVRLIKQIVRSFLSTDNRMIGRKFSLGPFFLPGLGSGVRMPVFNSVGKSPVAAVSFSMFAISS